MALVITACGDDGASASSESAAETSDGNATGSAASTATMTASGTSASSGASTAGSTGALSPCAASPEAMSDCVEIERYQSDLEFIADLRAPGSMHWQEVQDLCADRLTELGFEVDLFNYGSGVNVLGTRAGTQPDAPRVMIGAHYDHIDGCAGADDNATGVAGTLEAARVLSEGTFAHPLTIACWDEEERGLIGAEAFVDAAVQQGIQVAVYYNLEMIGYATDEPDTQTVPAGFDIVFPQQVGELADNDYRGNFILLVGDLGADAAVTSMGVHAERVGLPFLSATLSEAQKTNPLFGDLRRSDHAPFWDANYPAVFVTDTSEFRNGNYHCMGGAEDTVDTLTPSFTEGVIRATVAAAAESLVLQ